MSTGNPVLVHLASATKISVSQLETCHLDLDVELETCRLDHNLELVKVAEYLGSVIAHPVEDVDPAFEGDTLESCQHCQHKVVKVGDPKIWTLTKEVLILKRACFEFLRGWLMVTSQYSRQTSPSLQ